jgi:hypothetical protein
MTKYEFDPYSRRLQPKIEHLACSYCGLREPTVKKRPIIWHHGPLCDNCYEILEEKIQY